MTTLAKTSPLYTPLCERLNIDVPIILAGMGTASGPDLSAAVSNAGGLGVLGCTGQAPEEMRENIRKTKALTDRPFGVDIILPVQMGHDPVTWAEILTKIPEEHKEYVRQLQKELGIDEITPEQAQKYFAGRPALGTGVDEQIDVILDEKVAVFASGLGSPGFMVERAHAQGMAVMSVVGTVRAAQKCVGDGVDVIVAQGYDGGGHTGQIGTFVLIPQIVDAVSPVPVVGAGGVSDGRGLAAAIVFGCQAVWVGTRFLATNEANIPEWKKQGIVDAKDRSTLITRSYTGKPCRVIKNSWTDAWEKAPLEPLPMPLQPALVRPVVEIDGEKHRLGANLAGQGSGLVKAIQSADEVVRELVEDAEEIFDRVASKSLEDSRP